MSKHTEILIDDLKRRLMDGEIDQKKYTELFGVVSLNHTWIKPQWDEWLQLIGALMFGLMIGWITEHVIAESVADINLLVSVIGIVGGAAITALFPAKGSAFGIYSIGLTTGFFLNLIT